jgi:hypothetical protein
VVWQVYGFRRVAGKEIVNGRKESFNLSKDGNQ